MGMPAWTFRFKGVVSDLGEICAEIESYQGFFDDHVTRIYPEKEIFNAASRSDGVTDKGMKNLRKAFDAVRTAKIQQGIQLDLPDASI